MPRPSGEGTPSPYRRTVSPAASRRQPTLASPLTSSLLVYARRLLEVCTLDYYAIFPAHAGVAVPAAMFLGFARVFAANSFAIARILDVLRTRGGPIQETAGRPVQTLEVPFLAKAFIVLMGHGDDDLAGRRGCSCHP